MNHSLRVHRAFAAVLAIGLFAACGGGGGGGTDTTQKPAIGFSTSAGTLTPGSTWTLSTIADPVYVGYTRTRTLTIRNTGSATLYLSSNPSVTPGGGPFSVSNSILSVSPGGSVDTTVSFAPSSAGNATATLTVTSNDPATPTATFTLSGYSPGGLQSVEVTDGTSSLVANGAAIDLGNFLSTDSAYQEVFTIRNVGTGDLSRTVATWASISGDVDFDIAAQYGGTTIAAGASGTFTLRFTPFAAGAYSATVTVATDDPDQPTLTFDVMATVVDAVPEIEVRVYGSAVPLVSGISSAPISAYVGEGRDLSFNVFNIGSANLALAGTPIVAVSGDPAFTVTAQPASTVAPNGWVTFTIRYLPTSAGVDTATITFASNDADESPYTIFLAGSAYLFPRVSASTAPTTPLASGHSTSFATTTIGGYAEATFIISNLETTTLDLTPPVAWYGAPSNPAFTFSTVAATSVAAGGATTFTVRFTPTATTFTSESVVISWPDPTGITPTRTFDLYFSGTGVRPEINVKRGAGSILDGTATASSFGSVTQGSFTDVTFTIENTSASATLFLSGTPAVALSGTGASAFSVVTPPAASIAPLGTTTFTVRFAPTSSAASQTYAATVTIANNDANENPYDFAIGGSSTEWKGVQRLWLGAADRLHLEPFTVQADDQLALCYTNTLDGTIMLALSDYASRGAFWSTPDSTVVTLDPTNAYRAEASCDVVSWDVRVSYYDYGSGTGTFKDLGVVGGSYYPTPLPARWTWRAELYRSNLVDEGRASAVAYDYAQSKTYVAFWSSTGGDLLFSNFADGATVLPTPTSIDSSGTSAVPGTAAIALTSTNDEVYVAYYEPTSGAVKVARSINAGTSWTTTTVLANAWHRDGAELSLAVVPNTSAGQDTVYLSFYDYQFTNLVFAKSTDSGATWPTMNLSLDVSADDAGFQSSVAVSGSTVVIAFVNETDGQVKLAKSTDGGATWPAPASLAIVDGGSAAIDTARSPSVVLFPGTPADRVFVAYTKLVTGTRGAYLAKSKDGGATF